MSEKKSNLIETLNFTDASVVELFIYCFCDLRVLDRAYCAQLTKSVGDVLFYKLL